MFLRADDVVAKSNLPIIPIPYRYLSVPVAYFN